MAMLLSILSDPDKFADINLAVEWMVQDGSGVASDFLDNIYMKLCWSMFSLTAELCLRLAQCLIKNSGAMTDVRVLIEKALRLANRAEKKLTDRKGHVIFPIAYAVHAPMFCELQEEAARLGIIFAPNHTTMSKSLPTVSSVIIEPQNSPPSYFKTESGSSTGSGFGPDVATTMNGDGSNTPIRPSAVMIARFESEAEQHSKSSYHGSVSHEDVLEKA
jgi:hypothetical protein